MNLTMTDIEVQAHLQFPEPVAVTTAKGERTRARSLWLAIRNGKPTKVHANVDTPDGLSAMRNVNYGSLPQEVRDAVEHGYAERVASAPWSIEVDA